MVNCRAGFLIYQVSDSRSDAEWLCLDLGASFAKILSMKQYFRQLTTGVVINLNIRFGKPIVRGTRLTVEEVLGFLASGMTYDEIEREYGLTQPQIVAAIGYAAAFFHGEEVAIKKAVAV